MAEYSREELQQAHDHYVQTAQEAGVRLIACQMTVDVFGYQPGDFIDGVEFAGATAYMAEARRAHVTMFI